MNKISRIGSIANSAVVRSEIRHVGPTEIKAFKIKTVIHNSLVLI